MSVIIETSIGDITVDLFTDERPRCEFVFCCLFRIDAFTVMCAILDRTPEVNIQGRSKGRDALGLKLGRA